MYIYTYTDKCINSLNKCPYCKTSWVFLNVVSARKNVCPYSSSGSTIMQHTTFPGCPAVRLMYMMNADVRLRTTVLLAISLLCLDIQYSQGLWRRSADNNSTAHRPRPDVTDARIGWYWNSWHTAAIASGHGDAPAHIQQQKEEAAATPALNCDQEVAVQGRASRVRGTKKSTLPTNSPQKNTKYSLCKKRSPSKKLMTVISRTSFTRGGGDVEHSLLCTHTHGWVV